jgi:hypothetical protein
MNTNYDNYYNGTFRNARKGYYQNNYKQKDNKKYTSQPMMREVEINSLAQTEPSKQSISSNSTKTPNKDKENTSNLQTTLPKHDEKANTLTTCLSALDKAEQQSEQQSNNTSKLNDEMNIITNFKHDFIINQTLNDDFIFKDVEIQLKGILTKFEEIDINKKLNDINSNINENYEKLQKETVNTIINIKKDLENKIDNTTNQTMKDLNEIKALFSWQCISDLRNQLIILKGEFFSKPVMITSVYDFEKYYDSILSSDLKKRLIQKKSFTEIMHMVYESFKGSTNNKKNLNNSTTPLSLNNSNVGKSNNNLNINENNIEEEFWSLVNLYHNNNTKNKVKLKLNISGSMYRIIKHFRGIPDDIIIEFGDLVPMIYNKETIQKTKRKINTIINLLYEVLFRQIQMNGMSKIFAYGHIYYGNKAKDVVLGDFLENDIYFDFVQLKN